MNVRIIQKFFGSIHEAESYLDELCECYFSAQCVTWPTFSESGLYTFSVE